MQNPLLGMQVNEKTKKVCIPDGYAPPLAAFEAEVRSLPPSLRPVLSRTPRRLVATPLRCCVCRHPTAHCFCSNLLGLRPQDLKEKIQQRYRVRLILDNLPVTTYDLKLDPESVRPGFELGFVAGDRHYIHNHLMFNILVRRRCLRSHQTVQRSVPVNSDTIAE